MNEKHKIINLNNICPLNPLVYSVILLYYVPAVVCQHARILFSYKTFLHNWNILMESLAMFITYITKILRKKI